MRNQNAGSNFRDAKNLGRLSNRLQTKDSLSKSNSVDFYRFNLGKNRSVSASLNKLKNDVNIQIFDRNRSAVDQARVRKGGKGRGILRNLERGLYFIRVSLAKGKRTPYQLQLNASKPRPEPGNDPKRALNIGRLRGTYTDRRVVNSPNPNRFYRFKVNQITNIETTVSTASGSVQADLIFDANRNRRVDNGEVVKTAFSSASSAATVTLPRGTYYMRVQPRFTNAPVQYDLKLVATPDPGNLGRKGGGESLKKPRNIGTLDKKKGGTFLAKEYVGALDSADVLKFKLKEISSVEMNLSSNGSTQAQLIFDANGNKQVDSGEVLRSVTNGFSSKTVQVLPPGTYYVQVEPRFGSSTRYDLSLVATQTPGNLRSNPGSTLPTAFNVGVLNQLPSSTFIGRDYVGVQDPADVFRFRLTETRDVEVSLGSEGSSRFELVFDANENGRIDSGEVLGSGFGGSSFGNTINRTLAAGIYYVVVTPRFGDSTAYELSLIA
jgi:hypothetical protein